MAFKMKGHELPGIKQRPSSAFKETDPEKKSTSETTNLLNRLRDYEQQVEDKRKRDETLTFKGTDTTPDAHQMTLDRKGREDKARAEASQKRKKEQSIEDYIEENAKFDAVSARGAEERAAAKAAKQEMKDEKARKNALTPKERRKEEKAKRKAEKNA